MGNLEGQQRLAAALEESRLIEKEIDNENRRKDEGASERFIKRMTLPQADETLPEPGAPAA